jgi:hypothetical protein
MTVFGGGVQIVQEIQTFASVLGRGLDRHLIQRGATEPVLRRPSSPP